MSQIAALRAQTPSRPTTERPVAPVVVAKQDSARPAAPLAPTPPRQLQAFAAPALSVLIEAQAHAEPVVARIERVEAVIGQLEARLAQAAEPAAPPATHGHGGQQGQPRPVPAHSTPHGNRGPHGHEPPAVEPPPVVLPPVSQPPVSADPNPTQGEDDQHGHQPPIMTPPPVVLPPVGQPPVSVDPNPAHGNDDQHGHQPPVVTPPPVVIPPVVEPPQPKPVASADPAAPARTIAMVNRVLAEGVIAREARSAFEAASAERRAASFVAQGQAALAILKSLQAQQVAWTAEQQGATSYKKALYV